MKKTDSDLYFPDRRDFLRLAAAGALGAAATRYAQAQAPLSQLLIAQHSTAISYALRSTFTAPDNTASTAYTPEVGPSWGAPVGTFKTSSNKLIPNSNADGDLSTWESSVLSLKCADKSEQRLRG